MKIKMYPLIERIVEEGIESGYNRARKHTDSPDEETVKQCMFRLIRKDGHDFVILNLFGKA